MCGNKHITIVFLLEQYITTRGHCILGDDHQALIWDIQPMPQAIEVPILAYGADGEINQVQWSASQSDWICICYRDNVEILRV